MRRTLPVVLLLALPDVVNACAVCGAAADRNNSAFIVTTILLSLLPLSLIGAGLWWVGRRGNLSGEFAEREVGVRTPGQPSGVGER